MWLDIVNEDLNVAELLFNNGHWLYTGFMCHQVIEKTLKAYWCVCLDVDKVSLALLRYLKEKRSRGVCCPRLVLRLVIYRFGKSGFAWWKVRLCYVESRFFCGGMSYTAFTFS